MVFTKINLLSASHLIGLSVAHKGRKESVHMTRNQIDYWRNVYERQHNEEVRAETRRANKAQLEETRRANEAREAENIRTNLVNERIRDEANRIQEQHNIRNAGLTHKAQEITSAHNVATQDIERERIAAMNLSSLYNREVGLASAGAAYANVNATYDATMARLAETNRSNLINEEHNLMRLAQTGQQAEASLLQGQAAVTRAETQASELSFEERKWQSALLPESMNRQLLMQAQTEQANTQSNLNTANTVRSVVGTIGEFVDSVGSILKFGKKGVK